MREVLGSTHGFRNPRVLNDSIKDSSQSSSLCNTTGKAKNCCIMLEPRKILYCGVTYLTQPGNGYCLPFILRVNLMLMRFTYLSHLGLPGSVDPRHLRVSVGFSSQYDEKDRRLNMSGNYTWT